MIISFSGGDFFGSMTFFMKLSFNLLCFHRSDEVMKKVMITRRTLMSSQQTALGKPPLLVREPCGLVH